jgi:small nuclear ribonucleoprotein (snRNP)-like protein
MKMSTNLLGKKVVVWLKDGHYLYGFLKEINEKVVVLEKKDGIDKIISLDDIRGIELDER